VHPIKLLLLDVAASDCGAKCAFGPVNLAVGQMVAGALSLAIVVTCRVIVWVSQLARWPVPTCKVPLDLDVKPMFVALP
jgi:hypothetical protein